jgi:hypothetical protein
MDLEQTLGTLQEDEGCTNDQEETALQAAAKGKGRVAGVRSLQADGPPSEKKAVNV